ncbi:hypothetical protein EDB89DRAFT_2074498 [Lactarius sanguifluus]|nr:hypothetical protein EDB89DRAFT_2074498 [Lactarius sanguifluus]
MSLEVARCPPSPIVFQDSNGMVVKFFIQKDLPTELQAELCETITALGGSVEAKVPRQGFPRSAREALCSYYFLEACKIAGMLLKQIFVENGEAVKFHIDSSIANINARAALSARIMVGHFGVTLEATSLEKERMMFAIFLVLWGVVVLMGFAIIFWHSYGRRFLYARGKRNLAQESASAVPSHALDDPSCQFRRSRKFTSLSSLKHGPTKSFDSFSDHISPASAQPPPPELTISTERAASLRGKSLPELEHTTPGISYALPPSYEPKSAWSPDTAPTSASVNPGAHRKPSVPVSAVSAGEAESNAPSPAAVALAHVPMPLHYGYGYARAAPARTVYFPPSPSAALARVTAGEDFSFMPLSSAKETQAKFVAAGRAL